MTNINPNIKVISFQMSFLVSKNYTEITNIRDQIENNFNARTKIQLRFVFLFVKKLFFCLGRAQITRVDFHLITY